MLSGPRTLTSTEKLVLRNNCRAQNLGNGRERDSATWSLRAESSKIPLVDKDDMSMTYSSRKNQKINIASDHTAH